MHIYIFTYIDLDKRNSSIYKSNLLDFYTNKNIEI